MCWRPPRWPQASRSCHSSSAAPCPKARLPAGWSGASVRALLNLRGVGQNRTLVLLDSRRVVASTRKGTLDINLLPASLVRSVEVVTGGASAAYGSDAVSGVVNFMLDTSFTGLEVGHPGRHHRDWRQPELQRLAGGWHGHRRAHAPHRRRRYYSANADQGRDSPRLAARARD